MSTALNHYVAIVLAGGIAEVQRTCGARYRPPGARVGRETTTRRLV
jgi:hypothetical protein